MPTAPGRVDAGCSRRPPGRPPAPPPPPPPPPPPAPPPPPPHPQQFAPGLGELRAVAAAIENRNAEIFFKFLYRVGNGRRHTVQHLGGRGKTAEALESVQHLKWIKRQ